MTLQITQPAYTRRRFSVAEYERMAEAGILTEDDRVELIAGEIIALSPIGDWHAATVDRLNDLFAGTVRGIWLRSACGTRSV